MTTDHTLFHLRTDTLRAIDHAASWRSVTGVWDAFTDEDDLLRAAQQTWFSSLGSAIDVAVETSDGDHVETVRGAYLSAAARHPGLRRMLDEHAYHPAIEISVRREHAMIARAAGVPSAEVIPGLPQVVRVPSPHRGLLARMFAQA
jgi:hypothetical protein